MKKAAILLSGLMLLALPAAAVQKDATGCQDHPLFTRMPDYWIHSCTQKQFDGYAFQVSRAKTEQVEGKFWKINYYPDSTLKDKASELQIHRNFENAVKKLGGSVVYADKVRETLRLTKDGREIWVEVSAEFTGKYGLKILEKAAMAQDIVANAEAFSSDIRSTGHVAVYGIYFDTAKSDIKPESAQAIGEIAKLLKGDAALKVFVVGHTDSTGGVDSNLKLSQSRAEAVVQALVREHGIVAARLRAFGVGPFAPIQSNDTEEGKAKNRRVELVKQ
jgi:outer membrane protein OmpA-like peptidoglycan-associated protein